jgi:alpha-amylase
MVAFRNVVMGTSEQHWWVNGNYQIGFARGNKSFFLLNADSSDLNANLQTGLPQSTYCDVISGNYDGNSCSGTQIHVNRDGTAHFHISSGSNDPMIAIHIGKTYFYLQKIRMGFSLFCTPPPSFIDALTSIYTRSSCILMC